ncbi:DUF2897 family protein [Algicola sagamiensis]|nr:DUF2897 family protein [Algicola sagamiensis]
MNNVTLIVVVALVFGVIVGNIMLLKYSAKFKMKKDDNLKIEEKE